MSTRSVLELPRTSQAPGIARRWLAELFGEDLDSLAQEKAKLLVSELVTNAVVHGRGRMEIRAQLDRDRLLVEVFDEGPGFTPTVRGRHPDIAGGCGFRLVDEEASRWGIREGTADVWFELPRHFTGLDRRTCAPTPDARRPGQEPNTRNHTASAHCTDDLASTLPDHRGAGSARRAREAARRCRAPSTQLQQARIAAHPV